MEQTGVSVPDLGIKIIRGICLTGILFLLITWLIGAVLYVRGISNDLDFILQNTFFYDPNWNPEAVRAAAVEAGLQARTMPWLWLGIEFLLVTTFGTAGLIMFFRKKDIFGAYLGVTLILIGTSITGPVISTVSSVIPEAQVFLLVLSSVGFLAFATLLYVFPDGRFVPSWTKWLVSIFVVFILCQSYVYFNDPEISESVFETMVPIVYFTLGVASQIYRYMRVSGPVERQQTKWAITAFILFISLGFMFLIFFPNSTNMQFPPTGSDLVGFFVFYAVLSIVTINFLIAFGFAIFRYRLYDIDIIIRRTIVYGALTLTLVLVYFGSVLMLQSIFTAIGGQQSPIIIVISTLLIAALFNPFRRRLQGFIDRRFYRRRYDAQLLVDLYAITTRDETDIDILNNKLVAVVHEAISPESVKLWLKDPR